MATLGDLPQKLQEDLDLRHSKFPAAYPQFNPLDTYRVYLAENLSSITGLEAKTIYPLLQRTQTLDNGDLLLPVPALQIKSEKPEILAARWAEQFPESDLVNKPTSDGQFIRFFFNPPHLLRNVIPPILRNPKWGHNPLLGLKNADNPSQGCKRVVIEFSSPNIAKPFHQGHLRSTIIGSFLSNLYEGAGWDVVRLNYLGDWGKHQSSAYRGEREDQNVGGSQHDASNKEATALKNEGLDAQARQYFKAMCDADPETIKMWKRFRELSIERYKKSYARLNIHFDQYMGESMVREESMEIVEKQMAEKNLIELSQGAMIVDFTKHVPGKSGKSLGKALVRKQDGTSLYLTRDIGALFDREKLFNFDKMIYVVASDQEVHLNQLFRIIELTGNDDLRSRISHVNFGLVLGMSTRRGTVVFLDDVLRDVGESMHEVMKKNEGKYAQVVDPESTADILGISSVMVQDMSGKRVNNYHFNIETMTSFEGDTGPYLQYSHARLCSIFSKAGIPLSELESSADLSLLTEPHAINLIRIVAQFPDVILNTLKTQEPSTVLTYLFRLTHALNSSYDVLRVMGSEKELMKARLALYTAVRAVLKNGMQVLGLTPVDRM